MTVKRFSFTTEGLAPQCKRLTEIEQTIADLEDERREIMAALRRRAEAEGGLSVGVTPDGRVITNRRGLWMQGCSIAQFAEATSWGLSGDARDRHVAEVTRELEALR